MRRLLSFPPDAVVPSRAAVLAGQGIPEGAASERVGAILDQAIARFIDLAQPRAVCQGISATDFSSVYQGEGLNSDRTPVAEAARRADHLALFAVTLGQPVSDEITALFATSDLALAAMLDAVASAAADRAVDLLARRTLVDLAGNGGSPAAASVLPYSPGYCGWHITGQRRLFARLEPEEIGIRLNSSCLMTPLKSVSGVLLLGAPAIHDFSADFEPCNRCTTHACEIRSPMLREEEPDADPEPDR